MKYCLKIIFNNKFTPYIVKFFANAQIGWRSMRNRTNWWPNEKVEGLSDCKIANTHLIKLKFVSPMPQTLT